ncbi:Calx-beta domain-containing protein [Zoogloea sp. 1C4]|uniref:Calx-beta domain-containing protein n=1 Tax=Zoogloea sp. 1C4 TaxID=2570190 RepID=UPI001290AA42|nr:Calx-beta domain-containing protein [Zoogloea sp. 1C4]
MADILGSTSSTATLAINGLGGISSIETAGDQDWWKVSLTAGTAYTFRLDTLTFGGVGDPLLRLLDATGRQLAWNDDAGGTLNSALSFTATQSGSYFLSAQGYGSATGNYVISATTAATVPVLSIAATSASQAEGNSGSTAFTFTVTRSGSTVGSSTVNWAVAGGSASSADFTGGVLPGGTLTFAAGETSRLITINVAGDTQIEADEDFKVVLSAPTGATLGTSAALGTILNDDVLPTLAIAATSASKAEGSSGTTPFTFTVTRSGNTSSVSTVAWSVIEGTAGLNAADFSGPTSGVLSFAAGETSKVISLNVAGDSVVEANEAFYVNLTTPTGATLGTASATGTILNDDMLPTLGIAATSASKAEGNSGTTPFTFTVTRSGNTGIASSVNWAVANGTATAADFTGGVLPTGSVSFAVGETSKTITVNVAGDALVEANETFNVVLSGAAGATLGTASATGTILNDDTLPTLAIAATSASKAEGNSGTTPFTFTVTRSGNTGGASTVAWSVVEGTATLNAADFSGPTSGVLSFAAGETRKVISLNVAGDSVVEANEAFYVNLTTPTGATLGTASAVGTILNDDVLPTLAIAATSASKAEGNSGSTPFTFTVTRAGTTTAASTVNWAVSGGTATAADFTGGVLPGGSISFAVGETSKTITVNVAGDTAVEANETFNVVLSGAAGATLTTASAAATILNDDAAANRPGIDNSIAAVTYISVPSSVDDSIENLVSNQKWGGAIGTGASLTYSFSTATSVFNYENIFNGKVAHAPVSALTSAQRAAAQQAMGSVSAICNITFSEVADTATSAGDIRWSVTGSPNEGTADAWYPSRSALGGDIWFKANGYTNPAQGNYDYATFIHELGHAMGLDHPHSGTPAPESGEDQLKYSVMSYRSYDGAPLTGYTTSFYPVDYMLNDIAALQYLYGANTSYNTGNDVYTWTTGGRIYDCIWDAGGNDTIDASNQTQGVSLNLNAGSWSSIGNTFHNGSTYVRDSLGIAYGATIENAKGTALADTIVGNDVANRIVGGGGSDTLTGGNGADQFMFSVAADGGDTITDFSSAAGDRIQVIAANFGLTAGGTALLRSATSLPAAIGPAGQFLYNTTNGQLWFDRDGVGAGAAVQLATLSNRAALSASDIQLVSA